VTTDPRPADTAGEPAATEPAPAQAARSNRRRNILLLLVAVIALDVAAAIVVPPFPKGEPGKPISGIGDLILANLEFPQPEVVWPASEAHQALPIVGASVSITNSLLTMWLVMGVLLLVFIIVHILHFTSETVDPAGVRGMVDSRGDRDVYGNIVMSFHIWWVAAFYIVSMMALGLHLFHGAWSSVRTLGYAKPTAHPLHRRIALVVALVIWLGFTLIPVGVIAGIVR